MATNALNNSSNTNINNNNNSAEKKKGKKYAFFGDEEAEKNMNFDYLWSDYVVKKITPYGEVHYSHRYTDGVYIYRHVTLSRGVRKQAEAIAAKRPDGLLREEDIIATLGIDMSCGWEHFMIFKGKLKEIILRRPTENSNQELSDDGHVHTHDEASENSAEEVDESDKE